MTEARTKLVATLTMVAMIGGQLVSPPLFAAGDRHGDKDRQAASHRHGRHHRTAAVSYLKPDSFDEGHPASSKLDLLEPMMTRVVDGLQRHPDLFADTVFFVTFDEGGGYWDSGFFQPIDFFGDGPRIPMIAVSKFSRGGRIVHTYADHASVLKFIERNWFLNPVTGRSRDNLPNPAMAPGNPYVPINMPAIGDLFDMFDFDSHGEDHQ